MGVVVGVGSALGFLVLFPAPGAWLLLGIVAAVTVIIYVIGAKLVSAATSPCECPEGDFVRHLLVGLNAGLNGVLGAKVYGALLGTGMGVVVGAALGLFVLLSIFESITGSDVYQGFLGWANWLLPTSWLITGLGFLFWVISALGHIFGYLIGRSGYFRIQGMRANLQTGTFFTRGGLIANLNPIDTAFNMGNFAFVDAKPHLPPEESPKWHIDHEAGHTLNLAAFGSVFHLVGAIDENVTGGRENAFSERLAESNDPATCLQHIIIPMWTHVRSARQP